jgi:hypothetical protein
MLILLKFILFVETAMGIHIHAQSDDEEEYIKAVRR